LQQGAENKTVKNSRTKKLMLHSERASAINAKHKNLKYKKKVERATREA